LLDTDFPPGAAQTFGISQIVGIEKGHVRLTLSTPIALENFNGQATPMDTKAGITCEVNWLNSTTVDVYSFDASPDPINTIVSVLIFYVNSSATTPLPNPAQILGGNLAVWLQADVGAGSGPTVTNWVNRNTGNGDAVQGGSTAVPTLVGGVFGPNPGVRFGAGDQGLILTLTTPVAIGNRPFTCQRARLTSLVHTAGYFQSFYLLSKNPIGTNEQQLIAEASGTFDSNGYWDSYDATNADGAIETFITVPADLDTLPHTFQKAFQQTGSLVVDAVSENAPSAIGPVDQLMDQIVFGSRSGVGLPGTSAFIDIGVFVMSYTQPSPSEIAALKAWCDAYA
jgi:hypothetical protein